MPGVAETATPGIAGTETERSLALHGWQEEVELGIEFGFHRHA